MRVIAASSDRGPRRRTSTGTRDRWPWGAARSARVRCGRSGRARTSRRGRRARPWPAYGPDVDRVPRDVRGRCFGVPTHRAACRSEPYFDTAPWRRRSWYAGERQPLLTTKSTPSSAASVAAWRRAPRSAGSRFATPGTSSSKTVVPSGTAPSASPSASRWSPTDVRGWCGHRGRDRQCGRRRHGGRMPVAAGGGDRRDRRRAGPRTRSRGITTGRRSCWFAGGHASSQASGGVTRAYGVFDMPAIRAGSVASEDACVDRRGRALDGRGHPRWPAPGSDRGRHRGGRRHRVAAAERQRLRHRRPGPRHPGADRRRGRQTDRRLRQRHADPHAHRRRPTRRQGHRVRARRRRLPHASRSRSGSSCSAFGRSTDGAPSARPPVREIAGLRLDPFRREVYRDGRYVALTRKQFAVLEVLVAADGGVVSAEELLERAWDEHADPFTNAVRITVSALRKRLGEPGDHRHRARRRVPHRHAAGRRARGRGPWLEPQVRASASSSPSATPGS